MANSVIWSIAPLTPGQVAEFAAPFQRWSAEMSTSGEVVTGLRLWSGGGDALRTEVQGAFWQAMIDWSFVAELVAIVDPEGDGVQMQVARKLAPMAVLLSGLGWERARHLPGVAGSWLLDPEEVRAIVSDVERVFTMSEVERSSVLETMGRAAALGDQPDLDLDVLLDAIPRAFEAVVRDGSGLVSCTAVVE